MPRKEMRINNKKHREQRIKKFTSTENFDEKSIGSPLWNLHWGRPQNVARKFEEKPVPENARKNVEFTRENSEK